MIIISKYLKPLFFSRQLYISLVAIAFVFVLSYWFSFLFIIAQFAFAFIAILVLVDYISLFAKTGITVVRNAPERFSNGDQNKVNLIIKNNYSFKAYLALIDEIPVQFQRRNFRLTLALKPDTEVVTKYSLRPVERGE